MILGAWWSFGAESTSTTVAEGPQWVGGSRGHQQRVYPSRIRGDVFVLPGDVKSDDPALDTWEGEAT